jgi:hypothetical protein
MNSDDPEVGRWVKRDTTVAAAYLSRSIMRDWWIDASSQESVETQIGPRDV